MTFNVSDGDSRFGYCESLHSSSRPPSEHVCRFLADGLGTTLFPSGHVDNKSRKRTGKSVEP